MIDATKWPKEALAEHLRLCQVIDGLKAEVRSLKGRPYEEAIELLRTISGIGLKDSVAEKVDALLEEVDARVEAPRTTA